VFPVKSAQLARSLCGSLLRIAGTHKYAGQERQRASHCPPADGFLPGNRDRE